MAYSELVKKIDHIRSYMRDFYVYGFKSREDYDSKSLRSYDDERRRLESWLGEHMVFRRTSEGKYAFISIDSRHVKHNPLFEAWKAKSFTDGDITLHFILFDILTEAKTPLTLAGILEKIDSEYLCRFKDPMLLDESTVRKKLKEYSEEGLIFTEKEGKRSVYSLPAPGHEMLSAELLDFFSEVSPCGVVGSFLLDKVRPNTDHFAFKHHYITGTIDSHILCSLFDIMSKSLRAEIVSAGNGRRPQRTVRAVPLQIFISLQSGRQYLMAWNENEGRISSYRIDYILSVSPLEICNNIDEYREQLENCRPHIWSVICHEQVSNTRHIEFTIYTDDGEDHIYRRLLREKRCGKVDVIDKNRYRFSADVYDLSEMIPWIRTFICRIIDIKMDDKKLERSFKEDIRQMYRLYGIDGEDAEEDNT